MRSGGSRELKGLRIRVGHTGSKEKKMETTIMGIYRVKGLGIEGLRIRA